MKLLDGPETWQLDPLLEPLLRAPEAEAQRVLGDLITLHARPVIQGILRRRRSFSGPEGSDLEGEVVLHLIERLRRLRLGGVGESIRDFRGYVAVMTYNAVSEHLKKRGTERLDAGQGEEDPLVRLPDPAPDAAAVLERRTYLSHLWEEIRQLPERQAAALILNLRDGQRRNAVALLPLTGVATMREIALAIGMPAERFAAIWNRLPLEDAAIAELLGVTRQQVINLRKSARERLARRMRSH
jgi:DNA-directed RNA polymerase specialized sigma24 family protein